MKSLQEELRDSDSCFDFDLKKCITSFIVFLVLILFTFCVIMSVDKGVSSITQPAKDDKILSLKFEISEFGIGKVVEIYDAKQFVVLENATGDRKIAMMGDLFPVRGDWFSIKYVNYHHRFYLDERVTP